MLETNLDYCCELALQNSFCETLDSTHQCVRINGEDSFLGHSLIIYDFFFCYPQNAKPFNGMDPSVRSMRSRTDDAVVPINHRLKENTYVYINLFGMRVCLLLWVCEYLTVRRWQAETYADKIITVKKTVKPSQA